MFSDCEIVNHGLPQGTVLGPLIFLLYVNNFSFNMNTTKKVIQFADFGFGSIFYKNEVLTTKKLQISWHSNWQES